ncbi:MAG TPA: sensor histidine kinase, partial [Thermoanaerobaculia bacterium]|nr:sensor histidine kinase [Thermoanaerobaculia bacterium]
RAWTGVALYWGCGAILAMLPWLSRRLAQLDPSSLRTRLALALATTSSVALVLTAAVATSQEERLAVEQVIESRQIEANALARNIGDYIRLNAARTFALAAASGRAPWRPESQRRLLVATHEAYPDVTATFVLQPAGRLLVAEGRTVPLPAGMLRGLAADVRLQARSDIGVRLIPAGRTVLLTFTSPILGPRAELRGVLVTAFDSEALAQRIARPSSSVFLNDGHGLEIARSEISLQDLIELVGTNAQAERPAPLPPEWDLRARREGVLSSRQRLAAFAIVDDLGWVVAVESPPATALDGVRRGRDLAFVLLLLVVPLAVTLGIFMARRIARPLRTLSAAAAALAAGDRQVPLGDSNITEVSRLSASFAEMRDRLAERTRESERLATELRARAEALADSDRRKDEFLAMLAHELRNPLGAIANAAYVLDRIGDSDAPAARSVAVIQRQIRHLVRLVDDLLDVSRITRGKVELRREPVDFVQVVKHAIEMTRPVVDAREHELRLALPATPLPLHADATRLEQVVGNLLRNAAKYTEPGGVIEVEVHQEEGAAAVLSVRDNGMGISADLLPRVFDLFTQGEQDLDRAGAGLGIGLTLVRSLVEMHGGRVEAMSEGKDSGSRFVVRLPLAETADAAAQYLPTTPSEKVLPGASEATSSAESG